MRDMDKKHGDGCGADGVLIRRALVEDAAAIAALVGSQSVFENYVETPHQHPMRWHDLLAAVSEFPFALAAELDGRLVGWATLLPVQARRRIHTAVISVAVDSQFHRRGVARALLTQFLDSADRWLAIERIELTVLSSNEPAIALYRKLGFEVEGRMRRYAYHDGRLIDGLLMARLRNSPLSPP